MNRVHLENKKVSKQFYLIIWMEYALIYMTKNCFSAAMASIVYEGVLTKTQTGLINAIFFVFYGPLQIVGGIFADRYDPEKLIKIGLVSSGIINLLLFFFHSYGAMLVLWGLNGIAQFAVLPAIVKIITSQLAPGDRKSGAFYIAYASIGGLLISYLTAALITRWEYNFLVSGVILLGMAILWIAECRSVDHYMIADTQETDGGIKEAMPKSSTIRLFICSGFIFSVIYFFFRTVVDQSVKSFSPTMLTELYPGITPSIGNLLNLLIIGATMLGAIVIRKLYPKYIKSELTGVLLMSVISLPACGILILAGKAQLAVTVVCLCVVSCFLNCSTVLLNCGNTHFSKYGKSATAAGILNSVASVAFIFVNYVMSLIADLSGWKTVLQTLFGLLMVGTLIVCIAVPAWKRFISNKE